MRSTASSAPTTFTRRDDSARRRDRLGAQLVNLSYDVELTPAATA
jgi:hypothetical protein